MATSVTVIGENSSASETKLSEPQATNRQDTQEPAISVDAADISSLQDVTSQPYPPQSQSTTPSPPQNTAPEPTNEPLSNSAQPSQTNTYPSNIQAQHPPQNTAPPPAEGPPLNTAPYPPQSPAIPPAENNPAYPPRSYSATPSNTNYGSQHDQQTSKNIPPAQPSPQVVLRNNQQRVGITVIHVRNVERQIQRYSMNPIDSMNNAPPTHMRMAIISLFFCFIFGIVAVYHASQVNPYWRRGRPNKAILSSYQAGFNAAAAYTSGILSLVIIIVVVSVSI